MKYAKPLPELLGIPKEKLEKLIPFLSAKQQEFIKTHLDSDFNRLDNSVWANTEKAAYYRSISQRIKSLNSRDLNEGHNSKKHFLELIGISKDEFLIELPRFSLEIQSFVAEHFDQDLNFAKSFDEWSKNERNFYYYKLIWYLKYTLNDEKRSCKRSLPVRLNTSVEILNEIIKCLPERSVFLIRKYYTADYKPLLNIEWNSKDKAYFNTYTIPRIYEFLNNPYLLDSQNSFDDFPARVGVTEYQFKVMLAHFRKKTKEFIEKYYDENFKLKKDIVLSADNKNKINSTITKMLHQLIKKYGFDIINQQVKDMDNIDIMEQEKKYMNTINYYSFLPVEFYIAFICNNNNISIGEKVARMQNLRESSNINSEKTLSLARKKTNN